MMVKLTNYKIEGVRYFHNAAVFREEDHPRDESGRFGEGGGSVQEGKTSKKTDKEKNLEDAGVYIDSKTYVSTSFNQDPIYEYDEEGDEIDTGKTDDYVRLDHIAVDPAKQGQGIATRMIRETIKNIQKADPYIPIRLSALPEGNKAMDQNDLVEFYTKMGFEPYGEQHGAAVVMQYEGPNLAKENACGKVRVYRARA